ncbi:MAG: hypothetical protein RLZZ436_4298 [Planctomycetota bacterium]
MKNSVFHSLLAVDQPGPKAAARWQLRKTVTDVVNAIRTSCQVINNLFTTARHKTWLTGWLVMVGFAIGDNSAFVDDYPDVRSVQPDLVCPKTLEGTPEAGRRVWYGRKYGKTGDMAADATLMLPENWYANGKWPVFVELPGNGGYRDARGDECSGLPEDCCLGYGLTGGKDWIWVCLPFVSSDGSQLAKTWWGEAPAYDPTATLDFWKLVLDRVCEQYGGNQDCMVLAGFSRGSIAVNALGLREPAFAGRWKAFVANSHYDGVRRWPFPDSDRKSATERLKQLNGRPQLICGEGNQVDETQKYLQETGVDRKNLVFLPTGFCNHTDRWVLRPCKSREIARKWLQSLQP